MDSDGEDSDSDLDSDTEDLDSDREDSTTSLLIQCKISFYLYTSTSDLFVLKVPIMDSTVFEPFFTSTATVHSLASAIFNTVNCRKHCELQYS